MNKEDLLNSEFLKQINRGDELYNFMHELQKRGVEQLLEGEMDDNLDYEKSEKSENPNYRTSHTTKSTETNL